MASTERLTVVVVGKGLSMLARSEAASGLASGWLSWPEPRPSNRHRT